MTHAPPNKPLRLIASARIASGSLEIDYELSNDTSEIVYVYNQLRSFFTVHEPLIAEIDGYSASQAFCCACGDGAAMLYQGLLPSRGPRRPGGPIITAPAAIAIASGARFATTVSAALPLVEWNPWEPPSRGMDTEHAITRDEPLSRLVLRVMVLEERHAGPPYPMAKYPGVIQIRGERTTHLEAEVTLPTGCTLRRRLDVQHRFCDAPP